MDPGHWDGLPDGHTRAVTLDPAPQPPDRGDQPTLESLDPLAGLIAAHPAAPTPVAQRPRHAYDTAFSEWGYVFADDVLATAILDRLLHHCHVISINGPSYRLKDRASLAPNTTTVA